MSLEFEWADVRVSLDSRGQAHEESVELAGCAGVLTIHREYGDFGFLRRLVYPNQRAVLYEPDALNRTVEVRDQALGPGYLGDARSAGNRSLARSEFRGLRMRRRTYGNGTGTEFRYDGTGWVIGIEHSAPGGDLFKIQQLYVVTWEQILEGTAIQLR